MSLMTREYRDRLAHWQRTLQQDFYQSLGEVSLEGWTTMEQLTLEQARKGAYTPVKSGNTWGHTWEYMWLRGRVALPEEARGQRIVMDLRLNCEATLFVDGKAFGTKRAEWVSVPHHYMVDNVLTDCGQPGQSFALDIEAYAGHFFPDVGGCATGPVLPGSFQDPLTEGQRVTLGCSTFGVWNEDAYQLWLDVETLRMLMDELPEDSLRAVHLADALEEYTRIVDFEQDRDARIATYRAARGALRPAMTAHNGSTAPRMLAVGNAHLDLAWLWPQQETQRKTARTFAAQLRLLERYPEYRYIQSQPAAYEMCRERYPELYARIKQAAKEGRWIADGAMYVEPDTNMASGEALIRQLVYGKQFYREEFGVDSRVLWLPDTFGYTAALPQLLKGCGVDYLVTQKIFWSYNDGDRFPYHYFYWKGMDGSVVTSFLPTSYTYRTDPKELCGVWKSRVQKRDLDDFLIPFGYGDGGGGPCRDYVEYALREKDLEGMPKVEMGSPVDFFDELAERGGPKNTWDGELYFNAHRGTYTVQAKIKQNNRLSELALRDAELWCALASLHGSTYPAQQLTQCWKTLLLHQFHDILPGSSIARVYQEANAVHEKLQADVAILADTARNALCAEIGGVTVFNSLAFERTEVITLPNSLKGGAKTAEGEPIPVCDGEALVHLPSMGAVSLIPAEKTSPVKLAYARLTDCGAVLENGDVTVTLDALGRITSLCAGGREHVLSPMNRFDLYKDVPRLFDAWDVDSNYREMPVTLPEQATLTVEKAEGLTASLKLTRPLSEVSTLTQSIRLSCKGCEVVFDTKVDWHELHRLLKVAFPVTVRAENAKHEMQFGYVERPTHRSRAYDKDRFEVCSHRYTALCDEGHGCAVLSDSKYGVGVEESSIELTLLRAASAPEMKTDQGEHHFTYAFTAWEGSFLDSPVVALGYALNVPPVITDGVLTAFSAFGVDAPNVVLETVKLAEDGSGDLIARLYESKKADTSCVLRTSLAVESTLLCDMLENPKSVCEMENGGIALHLRPFEVLTLRLKLD